MQEFQIETAQNVGIQQNVANLGDRMLAYLLDSLIIIVYIFISFLLLISLDFDPGDSWAIYLLLSLPAFLYYVLLETFWNGKTVGKFALKTRVVKLDGSKPSFANYFVRWLLRIVDVVLTSGGVAVLSILIKGNGQRVGDIAAGTTVISERLKVSFQDTILKQIPQDYKPTYSQVTLFKDDEMQMIKNLYDDARRKGQHNIIVSLHNKMIEVMQVEPLQKPIDFVDTVIKDYNYYTQNM
ncbi:RDD family protein [Ichthyenterobacterium magnum]|uniref:Putative RDD family membrane protein YckC n=1 Tax=Ichthyenterobacterium magnum TaxID=1230530 RepID=A0A420DGN2_9FLAO|nr:RDD family protein [Ichthyenterobacterium magnum]RKE92243.1 putative RDD family membrane protein YckC [Ichthyenterobacterium magnum]